MLCLGLLNGRDVPSDHVAWRVWIGLPRPSNQLLVGVDSLRPQEQLQALERGQISRRLRPGYNWSNTLVDWQGDLLINVVSASYIPGTEISGRQSRRLVTH
jgi:hypothetical protein